MKSQAKRIKSLGRKYAKQAFHLTENDFIDLGMLERAYLAGYKQCLKEVQEIANENGDIFVLSISEQSLQSLVSFLKANLIPAVHTDIDRAAFNKNYKGLLEYLEAVDYAVRSYKVKLKTAILGK